MKDFPDLSKPFPRPVPKCIRMLRENVYMAPDAMDDLGNEILVATMLMDDPHRKISAFVVTL